MIGAKALAQLATLKGQALAQGYHSLAEGLHLIIEEHTPKRDMEAEARRADVWEQLLVCADVGAALEGKTDAEIGELLIEHVWGVTEVAGDMLDPRSTLIEEAAERLCGQMKCPQCAGCGTIRTEHEHETCAGCEGVGTVKRKECH